MSFRRPKGGEISNNPKKYFVYITSNKIRTVYYTGVTNDLARRIWEHKQELVDGFTKRYKVVDLVYFEEYVDVRDAIVREKQIKDYRREKKLDLIKKNCPSLLDFYDSIL